MPAKKISLKVGRSHPLGNGALAALGTRARALVIWLSSLTLLTLGLILLCSSYGLQGKDQLWAAVPRFGVDEQNSRWIKDPLLKTGFPFQRLWSCDLGGLVESQPILSQSSIYVQAGQHLHRISLEGKILARSPILSQSLLPSGSSPTYAWTTYGGRIYQATRDHRLWALDPESLQPLWQQGTEGLPYIVLSAGGYPEKRYRITASPLVVNQNQHTYIALGTASGDGSGLAGQYADNGFFVLEDLGKRAQVRYSHRLAGEVTGSPIRFGDQILASQNHSGNSQLISFDLSKMEIMEDCPSTEEGIPGSPAAEGERIYLADRQSRLFCYERTNLGKIQMLWCNPSKQDSDRQRLGSSRNLRSPAIGSQFIYLPIQHYKGGEAGAVLAVDKKTGGTRALRVLSSALRSNLLYWQPAGSQGAGYVLVFTADGKAALLDGLTLDPVYGFVNPQGHPAKEEQLLPMLGAQAAPEPIIADNRLLLVDGQGVLHAYGGRGPVNFICRAPENQQGTEVGLGVALQLSNQAKMDYQEVPLVIREVVAEGQISPIIYQTQINMSAGQTQRLWIQLPASARGAPLMAEINPVGHPLEKLEEIYPRQDNCHSFSLLDPPTDLEVISFEGPKTTVMGKMESLKAVVCNKSNQVLRKVNISWYQDGGLLRKEELDFQAGESKVLKWLWPSPKTSGIRQLKICVDPEAVLRDQNRLNNQKELYLTFDEMPKPVDCNQVLEQCAWPVTYSRITGYPQRQRPNCYVSYYGQLRCETVSWTDYSMPIWQTTTVIYHERLGATVQVNTHQGIVTDPQNPQPADRDSRGSWAIIPYARQQGLNPQQVTRAGYGFELKVITNYSTDWESKVPLGLGGTARPIGGRYSGPKQVVAEFYDTRGRQAGQVAMERTGGSSGSGEAMWELPQQLRQDSDGSQVWQRRHYTAVDLPDGDYWVLIRVSDAGLHGLNTCKSVKVRIYGSLYEDQYTSPARS